MNVDETMDPTFPDPDVLAEAERWFARRRGRLAAAEARAFDQWHAQPANAAGYARVERTWERIGALDGTPGIEAMLGEALAATARAPLRRRWWQAGGAVAAAACLVLALVLGLRQPPQAAPEVFATGPAQGRTVRLADGSTLQLDVDTEVSVQLLQDERRIRLDHGQAMFEVAHDRTRPFRVSAAGGAVTALGTRFLVRHLGPGVQVTLFEGSVAVEDGNDSLRLAPGQQARYGNGAAMTLREADLEVAGSWTRGRLLFRATPLAEVVAEVNRYAATPLQLQDPSLADIPVSGTFPVGDSRSVAQGLQALLPVTVDLDDPDRILIAPR